MHLYFVNKSICNDSYKDFCNNLAMTTFADRLKYALMLRGMTQSELAKRVGVKPQAIQYLCENGKRSVHTVKIADVLNMNPNWLSDGVGAADNAIDGVMVKKEFDSHVNESAPQYIGEISTKIPLISWVSAGSWCEAIDNYSVGDAECWLNCPEKCSGNTYALKVKGDSMTSPHGRSYPEGNIIFVDPQITPTSGSRVIAKIAGTNEVTFKELRFDSGRVLLKPLNPQYPTIDITDKEYNICGVIIGSYVPE